MKANVVKRKECGGVLVWSLLMMTMIVALVTFAIETFRLSTALSQQHDSAQFAAEAALADIRKCLKDTEAYPANNVNCLTRASQVAKEVIKNNILVGSALATNSDDIVPTFYNCSVNDDCINKDIVGGGCATKVNIPSDLSPINTRLARVTLKSTAITPIFKILGNINIFVGRGEGVAFYKANTTIQSSRINYVSFSRVKTC